MELVDDKEDILKRFHEQDLYLTSAFCWVCNVLMLVFTTMFFIRRDRRWLKACAPVYLMGAGAHVYEKQLRTQLGDPIVLNEDAHEAD